MGPTPYVVMPHDLPPKKRTGICSPKKQDGHGNSPSIGRLWSISILHVGSDQHGPTSNPNPSPLGGSRLAGAVSRAILHRACSVDFLSFP